MTKKPTDRPRRLYLREWLELDGPLEHGWQTRLARAIGVVPSYISNIEAGRKDPRASVVLAISEQIGVTVNDLYVRPPSTAAGLPTYSRSAIEKIRGRRRAS